MNKRILGLLLALCLVVGLLPVMAMAEGGALPAEYKLEFGSSAYTLKKYDTPIYFKNAASTVVDTANNNFTRYAPSTSGATEDDWNAMLVWKTGEIGPTLYLDGFRYDEYNDEKGAWRFRDGHDAGEHAVTLAVNTSAAAPLTIVITGEDSLIETCFGIHYGASLTIQSEGDAKLTMNNLSGGINGASRAPLTLNANLDVNVATYFNETEMVVSATAADITVNC
ncbi:MAG: hypothetical protein IJX37_02780, partial [Oscillospiraceae bacterium]|nr:hypothetical protein [Oscillospiraceae bacterium]